MSVRIAPLNRHRLRACKPVPLRKCEELAAELEGQWPRIECALTVARSGYVDCDYFVIAGRMDRRGVVGEERARAWDELARFYEWHLEHRRADELVHQPGLLWLVETWTDSMCYSLRRSAAYARGEDPGPVIMQSQRRPDLFRDRWSVAEPTPLPRRPAHRPSLTLVKAAAR